MNLIQTISRRWILLLATLFLMACGSAAAPPSPDGGTSEPTSRATKEAVPTVMEAAQGTLAPLPTVAAPPAASAAPPARPEVTAPLASPTEVVPAPLVEATPARPPTRAPSPPILLQHDYEPTYFRPETSEAFGRFPPFTLLDDGTVLYIDEGQPPTSGSQRAMRAQLSPEERDAFVRQVLDLGFERLQTYTDDCRAMPGAEQQMCVDDASFTVLRMRMPDGHLREVTIYADFTDDQRALQAIVTLLTAYRHPDAVPYVPEAMALFVKPAAHPAEGTPQPWPLDPALLRPPDNNRTQWAIAVKGDDVARLLAALPRNMDDVYVRQGEATYELYLVPWLPGVDYSDALPGYRQ